MFSTPSSGTPHAALPRSVSTERVALRQVQSPALWARLREPNGQDELAIDGVDTRNAVALLERLIDAALEGTAASLCAGDRDALLAALYRQLWGDRIVSSLSCSACGALFDLSFELSQLQRSLVAAVPSHQVLGPGRLQTADGAVWQLPDGSSELQAAELGAQSGAAALALAAGGGDAARQAAAADALEQLSPLLDVDLDSACAECGHAQAVRFDVQSFVLQRLLDEREGLLAELHLLASGYHWSLNEILLLPRSLRRSLAARLAAHSDAAWA